MVDAVPKDKRYSDPAWRDLPYFCSLKQLFLLQVRWTHEALRKRMDLPRREGRGVPLYARRRTLARRRRERVERLDGVAR